MPWKHAVNTAIASGKPSSDLQNPKTRGIIQHKDDVLGVLGSGFRISEAWRRISEGLKPKPDSSSPTQTNTSKRKVLGPLGFIGSKLFGSEAPFALPPAAMPQQAKGKRLVDLTAVPAGWPLATLIDAFVELAAFPPNYAPANRALEALGHRLVDLWASQAAEAEAWLERCRECFATELPGRATGEELLFEALRRHGGAQYGKYCRGWRFSEAALLRGEPRGSAAEREELVALYLQFSQTRDRCRELGERLAAAESQETARKRQKLEEETSERRRLEVELHQSQEEGRELSNRLAVVEAEVCSKTAELQTAQSESATCSEQCKELASRAEAAESAAAEMQKELGHLQEEHGQCQKRSEELLAGSFPACQNQGASGTGRIRCCGKAGGGAARGGALG